MGLNAMFDHLYLFYEGVPQLEDQLQVLQTWLRLTVPRRRSGKGVLHGRDDVRKAY